MKIQVQISWVGQSNNTLADENIESILDADEVVTLQCIAMVDVDEVVAASVVDDVEVDITNISDIVEVDADQAWSKSF